MLKIESIQKEIAVNQEDLQELQLNNYVMDFGVYVPVYNFDGLEKYQKEIDRIYLQQKELTKEGKAAKCDHEWRIEGSREKGRRATEQELKLMMQAFNAEFDALMTKVRFDNFEIVVKKVDKLFETINKLGKEKGNYITKEFLSLKFQEMNVLHEFEERKRQEREEQRAIREQMKEEERALRELEKAQIDAERETERYAKALEKAQAEAEKATGEKQTKMQLEIERLQQLLAEATIQRERAKSQAELTRSGYVYIISNIGSFGQDVYKIGMTRRLDPMDRVIELGDASVPFPFDVHAMIFTHDAPGLENTLHKAFYHRRLNLINLRKEFFAVQLSEIVEIAVKHKADVHFTMVAEAADWRKSQQEKRDVVSNKT